MVLVVQDFSQGYPILLFDDVAAHVLARADDLLAGHPHRLGADIAPEYPAVDDAI